MKFKYEELRMSAHPEERRIAGLLRELIVQSGVPLETLEERLGWPLGHLRDLLEGRRRLSFEDVLEVLPLMGTTPSDFFAWLYGFEAKDSNLAMNEQEISQKTAAEPIARQGMDRRFEKSLRVVREAIARRSAWKKEQSGAARK